MRAIDVPGRHGFLHELDHELLCRELGVVEGGCHLGMAARVDANGTQEPCVGRVFAVQDVGGVENSTESFEE